MRRLFAQSLLPAANEKSMDFMDPLQVACGAREGLDAIAHDVRQALEDCGGDDTIILVSADAENAFNRSSRKVILASAVTHAPSLALFANALYAKGTPYLRFGDIFLRSMEGTQQKDPASMLLFALDIRPVVRRIGSECDLLVHRWYADDRIICGKIEEVKHALKIIEAEGEKVGFLLEPEKTVVFCCPAGGANRKVLADNFALKRKPSDGEMKIPGVTPLAPEHVRARLVEKIDKIYASLTLISTIPDARTAFQIHRFTAPVCSIAHILRPVTPDFAKPVWREFDDGKAAWMQCT